MDDLGVRSPVPDYKDDDRQPVTRKFALGEASFESADGGSSSSHLDGYNGSFETSVYAVKGQPVLDVPQAEGASSAIRASLVGLERMMTQGP